jgi:purine nucleosidase
MAPDLVWVDCDPTLGSAFSDVDDALALWFLRCSGVGIAGVSTVFGNAPLARTDATARAIAPHLGSPPVHRGAAGPRDHDTPAARALAGFAGTVLALGPLTNVAAALARGASWERLVVLGGTDRWLPNTRPLHTTELNFALDLPAAARVLERSRGGAGLEVVTMEPCREVWFTAADLAGCPPWLQDGCRPWLRTSPLRTGRRAFHPWDLLAAAYVVEPSSFRVRRAGLALDDRFVRRGHVTYVDGTGLVVEAVDTAGLRARWTETTHRR